MESRTTQGLGNRLHRGWLQPGMCWKDGGAHRKGQASERPGAGAAKDRGELGCLQPQGAQFKTLPRRQYLTGLAGGVIHYLRDCRNQTTASPQSNAGETLQKSVCDTHKTNKPSTLQQISFSSLHICLISEYWSKMVPFH